MTPLELIICAVLLLMTVPDLCQKWQRSGLIYPLYVLAGALIGALTDYSTQTVLSQIGHFGFVLLLFIIGLEIDLPPRKQSLRALQIALIWVILQVPIILLIGYFMHLTHSELLLATIALTGCSVSIAYPCLINYPTLSKRLRKSWLLWMVALEVQTILLLSLGQRALAPSHLSQTFIQIGGMILAVILIAYFAERLTHSLRWILSRTVRWKAHFIALVIFIVAALGERLGLSGPKTAFFLGLFMHRATCEGMGLEHHLRPIGQQLLIPIFFVSLGMLIHLPSLISPVGLWAIITAIALLAIREIIYRRLFKKKIKGDNRTFLLLCPNLTMAAVATHSLAHFNGQTTPSIAMEWILLSSLWTTLLSVLLLPKEDHPNLESTHLTSPTHSTKLAIEKRVHRKIARQNQKRIAR